MFPELVGPLQEAFDNAEVGQEYVLPFVGTKHPGHFAGRLKTAIRRAGLTVWPRLWCNLRSTRETELQQDHPIHVVCAWLGNSVKIAAKHYLQVTDDHFAKAVQKAVQHPSADGRIEPHSKIENRTEPQETAVGHLSAVMSGL